MAIDRGYEQDPLFKRAMCQAKWDEDWAYRVNILIEDVRPAFGKSTRQEQLGQFDPLAPIDCQWLVTTPAGEVLECRNSPGLPNLAFSRIRQYARHGPRLIIDRHEQHRSIYRGEDDCRLTMIVEHDYPQEPFVRELRSVQGTKQELYRFARDRKTGTVLAATMDIRIQMRIGRTLLSKHRQYYRFDKYRYTGKLTGSSVG